MRVCERERKREKERESVRERKWDLLLVQTLHRFVDWCKHINKSVNCYLYLVDVGLDFMVVAHVTPTLSLLTFTLLGINPLQLRPFPRERERKRERERERERERKKDRESERAKETESEK